jgi:tRNA U34 5-carboxymethylaminomethyl modifying enzyme MnmG/GidA
VSEPALDYPQLLARVREVVDNVRAHSSLRQQIESLGAIIYEKTGAARFADTHTIVTETGLRLQAEKFIICTGAVLTGSSRSGGVWVKRDGTVAFVDDSLRQAELMRRRHRRVPPPRSGFVGFRFPREVIMLAVRWYLR